MQETEKEQGISALADAKSQPLIPVSSVQVDEADDDPDTIFIKAVAEIETQPLPRGRIILRWQDVIQGVFCTCLIVGSIAGIIWQAITYPGTLVILYTVEKPAHLTTTIDIPTRMLAPVTLTREASTPTTGKGHQDARPASGVLTFYNGLFTAQTVPIGTVFLASNGVKVVTCDVVTIPASNPSANPPQLGFATVSAEAMLTGTAGNIAAYEMNATFVNGVSVKNTNPFQNGRDARDFHAVAQTDVDSATTQVTHMLSQTFQTAFVVRPGEALVPTNCHTITTPNHQVGDEAQTVTMNARETCSAMAYSQDTFAQRERQLFTAQTAPGKHYTLVGNLTSTIVRVSPLTVSLTGSWVYVLSRDEQQSLAQAIQGETPAQARTYLLHTGGITQASVPITLPPAMYIQFLLLVGK